jgi:hypothetical protein
MKKLILFTILTLNCVIGFCQKDSIKSRVFENYHLYPSIGISYQKQLVGEVGVLYGYRRPSDGCKLCGPLYGIKLASEFNFDSNNFYIAPKLAFELDLLIINARINFIDYSNVTYHDLKITPEIGLSYSGIVTLHYGYNIPLTPSKIDNVGTHRVTLVFNYGLWKNL